MSFVFKALRKYMTGLVRPGQSVHSETSGLPSTNPMNLGHQKPVLIFIEANIGAGKSTLITNLRERGGYHVLDEPVSEWSTALQFYYSNRAKYAMPFQATILMSRILQLVDHMLTNASAAPHNVIVIERSPLTGQLFLQQLRDSTTGGVFDEGEDLIMQQWFSTIQTFLSTHFKTHTVYLRVSPQECLRRVRIRARVGEHAIDEVLLRDLCALHEVNFAAQNVIDADMLTASEVTTMFETLVTRLVSQ